MVAAAGVVVIVVVVVVVVVVLLVVRSARGLCLVVVGARGHRGRCGHACHRGRHRCGRRRRGRRGGGGGGRCRRHFR